MRRVRKLAIVLVVCWLAAAPASAASTCKVRQGEEVVLYSTTDDPAVLVWDSRVRLRDYSAASFDEAQALLPHALLVAPGTRATVISCVPNFVTSQIFNTPDDAVGVLILNGPLKGTTRWVLGSDVKGLHQAAHL